MTEWILVHAELGKCFDAVTSEGEPFPVAEPLRWVDVTAFLDKPQHGWSAVFNDGEWEFSNGA
jgi:hypothetical protein